MMVYLQMIESPREKSKFEVIYRLYRDKMYATAYAILGNPQDAEDAVHHAFIKIIENISKISDPECPKTKGYVVTIVENTSINLYRQKKRRASVPFDEDNCGLTVEYRGDNELARCMAA